MRWLKRDMWKAGIALAGMLLLLVLMVWVPVSAAGAYEETPGLAIPVTGTVQATPTEDATVTALNKEKLAREVQQLKSQNALDLFSWLRTNAAILLSTLVVVIGGLIGLFRWRVDRRDAQDKELEAREYTQDKELEDRQNERKKRDEERFQSAVTGLGDEKEGARISAAITLRTFLYPGYEQFYIQIFDLAIAHLRLPRNSHPPEDPNAAQPLNTLSQALIAVFKEAFPLARDRLKKQDQKTQFHPRSLDATGVQLDNAYLVEADLTEVWMPRAFLRKANLSGANLSGAVLSQANLSGADLIRVNLSNARLREAKLSGADLSEADLTKAKLSGADLSGANISAIPRSTVPLSGTPLSGTPLTDRTQYFVLYGADLSGADLSKANLNKANLNNANLSNAFLEGADLSGANLSNAFLEGADLEGANLSNALQLHLFGGNLPC